MQWWWLPDVGANPRIWRSLGNSIPPYEFPMGEFDSGMKNGDGKRLFLIGNDVGVVTCARKYPETVKVLATDIGINLENEH